MRRRHLTFHLSLFTFHLSPYLSRSAMNEHSSMSEVR